MDVFFFRKLFIFLKFSFRRFVETELTKHHKTASDRWGFNFVHGYPLSDHKQFMWERVPPTSGVPQMYTLSRAAHTRPIHTESAAAAAARLSCAASACLQPTFDELLDERAERANRPSNPRLLLVDHSASSSTSDESDTSLSPQKAHISLTITAAASPIMMQTRSTIHQQQSTTRSATASSPASSTLRSSPREKRQPRITGERLSYLCFSLANK